MTIHTDDETDDRDHVAELIDAAERATPEDTSLDDRTAAVVHALRNQSLAEGMQLYQDNRGAELEALANSEAVQDIIDLRLAQERVRMLEDCRRRLRWVSVVSSVGGFSLAAGFAALFLL